jgi:predicted nucleotidyltransferase
MKLRKTVWKEEHVESSIDDVLRSYFPFITPADTEEETLIDFEDWVESNVSDASEEEIAELLEAAKDRIKADKESNIQGELEELKDREAIKVWLNDLYNEACYTHWMTLDQIIDTIIKNGNA